VEIEQDGRWLPGLQHSWRRWDDDRGWVAEVEYTVVHPWGIRTRIDVLPADRVRPELPDGRQAAADREPVLAAPGPPARELLAVGF
jgi:hypothetical protein